GDARGGWLVSGASYPWEIPSARTSAQRLADFLGTLSGPEGTPSEVSVVAHSLGCRLALEALEEVRRRGLAWPGVRFVAWMAPAVPTALVQAGAPLEAAARFPQTLAVFFSSQDNTLRRAFPPGQRTAYWLGFEQAYYP